VCVHVCLCVCVRVPVYTLKSGGRDRLVVVVVVVGVVSVFDSFKNHPPPSQRILASNPHDLSGGGEGGGQ